LYEALEGPIRGNRGPTLIAHSILGTLVLLVLLGGPAWSQESDRGLEKRQPNILIILTDDQGYGDVSTYHPSDVQTPHIDALAQEGMLFTSMRANCTVCSPTRAALMTGKYPDRAGVPGVIRTHAENSWGYLDPAVATLPQRLGELGYHTGIVGKWHLGLQSPNTPNERGFDLFHGFLGDMMDSYLTHRRHGNNYMRLNQREIDPPGHATDLFASWAAEYISDRGQHADQPFFLYLAFNAPHFPIEPPDQWLRRVRQRDPDMPEDRAKNVAFVEHLDDCIGSVLEALDRAGLADSTLVAMTADNGGSLAHAQSNDPWRDGKQSHFDGGLRVPFIVRWPTVVRPGTTSDYQGLVFDLFPTAIEAAGGTPANDLDAVSLLPILQGGEIETDRTLYFVRREGGMRYGGKAYHAVIQGPWKLLQNDPYCPMQLYNLELDPREQHNVVDDHAGVVRELSAQLRKQIQYGGQIPWQPPAAEAIAAPEESR
jgi:arylsulfatase A-like enzyme